MDKNTPDVELKKKKESSSSSQIDPTKAEKEEGVNGLMGGGEISGSRRYSPQNLLGGQNRHFVRAKHHLTLSTD